jgi:pyridoxine 5-phosphate synthase
MAGLSVNLDCLGGLREVFVTSYPDVAAAAVMAELGNAEGIEAHMTGNHHSIREQDIIILRQIVQSRLILKISPTSEMIGSVLDIKPDLAVLVPENFDRNFNKSSINSFTKSSETAEAVTTIQEGGTPVCMMIDPDPGQLKAAHKLNVSMVEIYSGTFCGLKSSEKKKDIFNNIVNTIKLAYKLKIGIRVGSGLCYKSIKSFRELHEIDEFSIGRSIISRAVFTGMERAVKEMENLVNMV